MLQKRILLVDENLQQLFLTKAQLQQSPEEYEIEIAVSESEAIEKIRSTRFDCILNSIEQQGGMDGLALSKTLNNLNHAVPIIFLAQNSNSPSGTVSSPDYAAVLYRDNPESFGQTLIKTVNATINGSRPSRFKQDASFAGISSTDEKELASLRAAFRNSDSLTFLLSPDGLTVERCTPGAEQLFKPEHFLDKTFQQIPLALLIAQEDRGRMRQFIRDVIADEARERTFKFVTSEMEIVELHIRGLRVEHGGMLINLLMFASSK